MRPKRAGAQRLRAASQGMALVLGIVAPPVTWAAPPQSAASSPRVIDHNSRSFRIPFNIDPSERSRIKEALLTVSEDQGRTWKPISRTTPDKPALAYRAPRDGEYWFAVQTLDIEGKLFPANDAAIEPKLKVIVDTTPPNVTLESDGRRGSMASVRWNIRDERIDRDSFVLEYQAEGARDWRQVPLRRPIALAGRETWDAGSAGPIKVRAGVADRAGNTKESSILLPDGTPDNPALRRDSTAEVSAPPPLGSFASTEPGGLPQFPSEPPTPPAVPTAASPAPSADYNPFDTSSKTPAAPAADTGLKPQLIRNPKFNLQYEVEDAGPNGPATVELWVTQDGGRTWSRRDEDPDRKSPFPVDLGGEGTFGLTLVAKSASNLGDPPPGPGDRPDYLVEVDSTPPSVKLDRVHVGTGSDVGRIAVLWHAGDLHLGATPVVILVRAEGSTTWQPIGPAVENSGKYLWTLPTTAPARFYVRIDVVDTVGNRGSDETPDGSPILVDRTRPKSRIIGLESSTRNATGPGNGSIR